MRGEGRTAEAYDTCTADAVDDLLGLEGALLDEGRGAVDALFPLLLFALCDGDDDGGALVATRIEEAIDLRDLASDGGVDVGRYEARRLGDDSTYLDEVAFWTVGVAGAPMCWPMGMMTSRGSGSSSMGRLAESLFSGG